MNIPIVLLILIACAHVGVGTLWYSRFLFGRVYRSLSGLDSEKQKKPFYFYPLIFFVTLFSVLALYFLIFFFAPLYIFALCIALLVWIAFIIPPLLALTVWEGKKWKLFFIHSGFYLVSFVMMVTLLYIL